MGPINKGATEGRSPGDRGLRANHLKPVLRAYAFTEWSRDVPQRPNGTNLWVQGNAPNQFEIWYSPLNWEDCLRSCAQDWVFVGIGYWEPA